MHLKIVKTFASKSPRMTGEFCGQTPGAQQGETVRTVKTRLRPKHPSLGQGEVPHRQLKRELAAGFRYFFGNRPHLHQPGRGLSFLDFTNRFAAKSPRMTGEFCGQIPAGLQAGTGH